MRDKIMKSIIGRFLLCFMCFEFCMINNTHGRFTECKRDGISHLELLKSLEKSLLYMAKNAKYLDLDALFGVALVRGQLLKMDQRYLDVRKCLILTNYLMNHPRVEFFQNIPYVTELIYSPLIWMKSHNDKKGLKCLNKNKELSLSNLILQGDLKNTPNESQSDFCLSELARHVKRSKMYSTKIECKVSDSCSDALKGGTPWGYGLLHRILFNIIAVSIGCKPINSNEQMCCKILEELEILQANNIPLEMTDLFIEEVLICSLSGYNQFLRNDWIKKILEWQNPAGCWWDFVTRGKNEDIGNTTNHKLHRRSTKIFGGDGCSTHTTGISVVLLSLAANNAPRC